MVVRFAVAGSASLVLVMLTLVQSPSSWAQDGVPIGTVPLFPPSRADSAEGDLSDEDRLLQFNLNQIEISGEALATGVEGRLAVRSGQHIQLDDQQPQRVSLPVQLFGENELGIFDDPVSGVSYQWNSDLETGELHIPFSNDRGEGVTRITTGRMIQSDSFVSAEVKSVEITVRGFSLSNETQVGAIGGIKFSGMLVPEVFLIALDPVPTTEVASIWQEIGQISNEYSLEDVLGSTSIEAGFLGSFDGVPTLEISTSSSWKNLPANREIAVVGETESGTPILMDPTTYRVASEGSEDIYRFENFSGFLKIAVLLVEPVPPATATPVEAEGRSTPVVGATQDSSEGVEEGESTVTPDSSSPTTGSGGLAHNLVWVVLIGGLAGASVLLYRRFWGYRRG